MRKINVLVVDDEPRMRKLIKDFLTKKDYDVMEAQDGENAIEIYKENIDKIDLILLDVMMPKLDGWSVLREVRETSKVPIIMLTARDDVMDKVTGFQIGADDYVSKPFGIRELLARIKAVLRRYENSQKDKSGVDDSDKIIAGDIVIDKSRHFVTVNDSSVDLTYKEYELLSFLAKNRGRVYSRDELLDKVWGIDYVGESRTVDVHIRHLRQKIGQTRAGEEYIETIRGRGYKLKW